jgi:hypothetical protein
MSMLPFFRAKFRGFRQLTKHPNHEMKKRDPGISLTQRPNNHGTRPPA